MLKREIDPTSRRSPPGFHLLEDRVSGKIARDDVAPVLGRAIIVGKFALRGIQQSAAELVAKRIPHDRIHADEARREMADRKELYELHIDELGAGAQRQRIAVTTHIGGAAVAAIKPRQSAGCD